MTTCNNYKRSAPFTITPRTMWQVYFHNDRFANTQPFLYPDNLHALYTVLHVQSCMILSSPCILAAEADMVRQTSCGSSLGSGAGLRERALYNPISHTENPYNVTNLWTTCVYAARARPKNRFVVDYTICVRFVHTLCSNEPVTHIIPY